MSVPPANAPALNRRNGGLARIPELHVGVDELTHHAHVRHRIPNAPTVALTPAHDLLTRRLGGGRPVEAIAGAEGFALGAQQNDACLPLGVAAVDRLGELVAQARRGWYCTPLRGIA